MRTMLICKVPVERGNQAFKDGSLKKTIEGMMGKLKPEAAYFLPLDGKRCSIFVFDMADPSQIPQIAEQLFLNLDAEVVFTPVMNGDDLQKGLAAASA